MMICVGSKLFREIMFSSVHLHVNIFCNWMVIVKLNVVEFCEYGDKISGRTKLSGQFNAGLQWRQ